MSKLLKQKLFIDRKLLILVILMTIIGIIVIADASAPQALNFYGDKLFFLKQQSMWAVIGLIGMIIASKIHYSFWEKIATPLFGLSLLFLFAVLIPGIGFSALGAKRWISVAGFNFQPSEVIKLSLILYLSKVASKNKKALAFFIPPGIVLALIMLQPDLGTSLVIAFAALAQIFVSGVNIWYFVGSVATGILGVLALITTSPYRKERLLTYFEVTRDPLGSSYHIRQILLAIGSGGIFGVGLGASRQKYLFLPESSTDSIFAIIAEELGVIGGLFVISLFVYFVYRGILIAKKAPDTFSKVLAIGIVSWVGGQAFLNIASMVALVPLTGIPLPFISYGGSSLVMLLAACGILLNISKYAHE